MYGHEQGPAAVYKSHYDQQTYGYHGHDGVESQYHNGLDNFGGAEPSYLKPEQPDRYGQNSNGSGSQTELDAHSHSPYLTASSQGSYYPDNGSTPYSTPQMGSHGGSSSGSYGAHSASGGGGGGASGGNESASGNMAGFGARKFAEQQRKIEEYRERKERERYQQEALERQRAEWEWQQRQQAAEEEQRRAAKAQFEQQERRRAEEAQRLLEEEQWRLQQQQQQHDERQRRAGQRANQAQRSSPEHWNQQMDQAPSSQGYFSGLGSRSRSRAVEYSEIVDQTYRRQPAAPQEDPYARYTITQADHSSQRDTYKASPSKDALQVGRGGVANARKSMLLNTVDEELPKAKCADCGSQISFEQLASHRCVAMDRSQSVMSGSVGSSGKPSPLTLTINLPAEAARHDGPSSAGSGGKSGCSPFLERYDGYTSSRSASNLSPNTEESDPYRNMPSSAPPLGATSFAEAEEARIGAERKRQIAAQREAKKRASPAVAAEVVVAAMRFEEGAAKAKKDGGTLGRLKQQSAREAELQRQESSSSSVSSAQSSLLEADRTGFSRRARAGSFDTSGAQSATLTPSSSYDRFSNAQDSPASSKSKAAPKMPESLARQEWPTMARSSSSDERNQRPSQEGRRPSQDDSRSVSSSGAASGRTRKGSRKKSDVDIAGIETLMRDLQTPGATNRPGNARRGTEADILPSHSLPARRGTESDIRRGHSASGSTEEDRLRPPKPKPSRSQTTPTTPVLSYSPAHFSKGDNGPTIKERRVKRRCAICNCSLSSSKTPFVERDGQYFCAKDYATRYLPRCRKCSQPVESNAVKSSDGALRGIFHRDCFTCFDCDTVFEEGTFYVFENSPYCAEHYHQRNGTLCEGCGEGIEGQCKQTEGGERYHPHCLRCQFEGLTAADKGEFCQEVSWSREW